MRATRWLELVTLVVLLAVAVRVLHREPHAAGDLRVTPDEVEYAVCAQRIATLGRYDLEFDGVSVPPHSTPWFSALLAPIYLAAPDELGHGILVVLALSLAGIVVLNRIGERIAGPLGGALAPIAVLATPLFPYTARLIMTDAPAVTVALAAALLFLRVVERGIDVRQSLIAGTLVAVAFALRSVYLSLLLPFAWLAWKQRERRLAHALVLLVPLLVVLVTNAFYNHTTFGDWRRTGYQLWCAVPYDYPELLLSTEYFAANLADLTTGWGPPALALGAIGIPLLLWRERVRARPLLAFILLTATPISLLHSLYFYVDLRFHSFLLTSLAALGGLGLAALFPRALREQRWLAIALLAAAWFAIPDPFEIPALRRRTADEIQATTPRDAVVISGLEPVYLDALEAPGASRSYIAASRGVEFASKLLAYEPVAREIAKPRDAYDHRAPGLVLGGAREAIARTADEMPAQIAQWVREGRSVFLERSFLFDPSTEARILGAELRLAAPRARISQLVLAR